MERTTPVTYKLDEFFSCTELEKLVNQPPQDPGMIRAVVARFEAMENSLTPQGEDVLEALLIKRPVAMILLGHLRLSAHSHAKTTTRRMIDKRALFKSLARGFRESKCNFAKAIYSNE